MTIMAKMCRQSLCAHQIWCSVGPILTDKTLWPRAVRDRTFVHWNNGSQYFTRLLR